MKEFKLTPSDGISLEDDIMQVDSNNEMYKEGGTINENGVVAHDWWDIASWNRKPKTVSKIKNKELNERNKELLKVLSKITSDDKLRPVLGGVNFSKDGYIQVTDAHRFVQIEADTENYKTGIYDPKNGKPIVGDYPNLQSIIPDGYSRDEYPVVDLKALKTYADAIQTIEIHKVQNNCIISYKNQNYTYVTEFISDLCSVAISLGYDKLNVSVSENGMIVMHTGTSPKTDEFTSGVMPVYGASSDFLEKVEKGTIHSSDYNKEINCVFNVNTNMVESIGEEIDPLKDWIDEPFYGVDKDDVMVLKTVLGKNKTLPILEYLKVDEEGIATVSDLDAYISLKTELPKGIYYIYKNNILRDSYMGYAVEDFPSWDGLIKDANKIDLGVMNQKFAQFLNEAKEFASSSDELNPVMTGVCMRLGEDGNINIISTDGHSLYFENTNTSYNDSEFKEDIILNSSALNAISKINSTENKIEAYNKNGEIYLEILSGKYIIKTSTIYGVYPVVKNVVPDTNFYKEFKISDFKELLKIARNKNVEKTSADKLEGFGVKKGSIYSRLCIRKNDAYADILVPVKYNKENDWEYDIINTNLLKSKTQEGAFFYGDDSILVMPVMNYEKNNLMSFSLEYIDKVVKTYGMYDNIKMYFVDELSAHSRAAIFVAEGRGVKQQEQIRKSEEPTQNKKRPFGIVVNDVTDGEIINDFYNEYLSINNEEEAKAYEDKLRKQRFGTYNERTVYSLIENRQSFFHIKFEQTEKKPRVKDFVLNLEKVLVENKEDRAYTNHFKKIASRKIERDLMDIRSREKANDSLGESDSHVAKVKEIIISDSGLNLLYNNGNKSGVLGINEAFDKIEELGLENEFVYVIPNKLVIPISDINKLALRLKSKAEEKGYKLSGSINDNGEGNADFMDDNRQSFIKISSAPKLVASFSGLSVLYPIVTKKGNYYAVQSPENKEKGIIDGVGNSLVGSLKEAEEEALMLTRQHRQKAESLMAMREANNKEVQAKKANSEKIQGDDELLYSSHDVEVTLKKQGLSNIQRGNLYKSLDKKWRSSKGGDYSILERLKSGYYVGKRTRGADFNRSHYNRLDYAGQKEYERNLEKKKVYMLESRDGYYIDIPKIIYDNVLFSNPSKPLTAKDILNNPDLLPENTFVYDATGINTKEGVKELMNRHENGQKLIVHIDNKQVELFKSLGWNITSME